MRSFRLIPDDTQIPFARYHYWVYAIPGAMILLTLILLPTKGLNFGIDFRGGILIEVGMPGQAADLAAMRSTLGGLRLGEIALQEFGGPANVLIRVERQEGGEQEQLAAVDEVKAALADRFGNDIDYRRVEVVGPRVSADLLWDSAHPMFYATVAILIYIWFRFEWQFAIGAIVALVHDAVTTLGVFSVFARVAQIVVIAPLAVLAREPSTR